MLSLSSQGLDDTVVAGEDYLADLREFRDDIKECKRYWTERLMDKKIVLSSDPLVGDESV